MKVVQIEAKFENNTDTMNEIGKLKSDQQILHDLVKKIDGKLEEFEKTIEESLAKIRAMEEERKQSAPRTYNCFKCPKKFETKKTLSLHIKTNHPKTQNCYICNETFDECWKLEKHMRSHNEVQKYNCDICEKSFCIKWRLKRHMAIHGNTRTKTCHYFNNGKECPFSEIGCMSLHELSEECKLGSRCERKLCQFQHSEKTCKVCDLEFRIKNKYKGEPLHF